MERGNSKHGPRVDEQMSREVASTVRHGRCAGRGVAGAGARRRGPAGDDAGAHQRHPQRGAAGHDPGRGRGTQPAGPVHQALRAARRPARLRHSAEENEAPDDILAQLDQLPADTEFQTVSEVWAALGHANETQRW